MSLSARLATPQPSPIHGKPCSVGTVRSQLPSDEQAALDRMLWELDWTDPQILSEIAAEGYTVRLQQIGKHRRGQCRCARQGA